MLQKSVNDLEVEVKKQSAEGGESDQSLKRVVHLNEASFVMKMVALIIAETDCIMRYSNILTLLLTCRVMQCDVRTLL